jgi:hypothetical protein
MKKKIKYEDIELRNKYKYEKTKLILKRDSNFDVYCNVLEKLTKWINHEANYTGREKYYKSHRAGIIEALSDHIEKVKKENIELDTQINDLTRTYRSSE